MNQEKLALLKKLYKERLITLNEMARKLGVSFHTFQRMRKELGLTDRYIQIKKPHIELTPGEIAQRAAEVREKHLAHKKENGRPEYVPSNKPGYRFCAKNFKFTTFET